MASDTATTAGAAVVSPRELSNKLGVLLPAREPVLITGAPGIGKSDIVAQACAAAGQRLEVSHPVVSDPTDYKGLPAIVDGHAEFLPFGDLRVMLEASEPTVVFLDDLGQAPACVQAAAMQLLLARRINGHAVSDSVTFCAATNRRGDKAGVAGILSPVRSRFAGIYELQPTVDDWCDWALGSNIPAEFVALIRFRPDLLHDDGAPTSDIVNTHNPRTIAAAARLYALGLSTPADLSAAAGEAFAVEAVGFLSMWKELPSIDGILVDPDSAPVPTEPAALYAVSAALASKATDGNAERVIKYADRLPAEFSVYAVRDAIRRVPSVQQTRAFIEWASKHKDILV